MARGILKQDWKPAESFRAPQQNMAPKRLQGTGLSGAGTMAVPDHTYFTLPY